MTDLGWTLKVWLPVTLPPLICVVLITWGLRREQRIDARVRDWDQERDQFWRDVNAFASDEEDPLERLYRES